MWARWPGRRRVRQPLCGGLEGVSSVEQQLAVRAPLLAPAPARATFLFDAGPSTNRCQLLPPPQPAARAGEYDLQGVKGSNPGIDARFRRVAVEGTVDGPLSQADLDRIAEQVR